MLISSWTLVGGETRDGSWSALKPGGILVSALGEPSPGKTAQHGRRGIGFRARADGSHNHCRHDRLLRITDHHVSARRSAADVDPKIVRLGDIEGQVIVVVLAAPDQDLEPFDVSKPPGAPAGLVELSRWKSIGVKPAATLE
jgi:hypothetical protein